MTNAEKRPSHNVARRRIVSSTAVLTGIVALGAMLHPWRSESDSNVAPVVASAAPAESTSDNSIVIPTDPTTPYHFVLTKPTLSDPKAERLVNSTDKLPSDEQLSLLIGQICTMVRTDNLAGSLYGGDPDGKTAYDLMVYYDWRYATAHHLENQADNEGGTLPDYYAVDMNTTCPDVLNEQEK